MARIKVLHMADMHLDWPFAGMGADSQRGRMRREELKEVFAAIVDLALQEQVQVMLIAGDLFEHAHATRATAQFLDQQFRRLSATQIFISPGNHDPLLPTSYYRSYPWPANVHIFGPQVERVDLPSLPVSVYGWGFGHYEVTSFQLEGLRMADPSRINLVVVHGGDERYHPFRPANLRALGADYIALGHIHKAGEVLVDGGRVIARYPGSPEALHFGEPGIHGVYLGTIAKAENQMAFIPMGRRQYISAAVPVGQCATVEEVAESLLAVDGAPRRQQHAYRLNLTGALAPDLTIDLPVLQERLAPHFYHLRLVDQTQPDWDLEALARERSARGLFVQRLLSMEAETRDPARRTQILRALQTGLAAFAEKEAVR